MKYDFHKIESKWQAHWEQQKTMRTPNPGDADFDAKRPKFYVLDMFPYPSGIGLHVGHPLGYIATDITARYKRMTGYNVLHPMGFDAFGLPAEQYAVEHGVHPRTTTEQNINNMVRQLKRLGLGYDWDRQLATTDPEYFKWTQWIFLQLYESWFDPELNKARPIEELINALEQERYYIGMDGELINAGMDHKLEALAGEPIGVRKWHELRPDQKRRLLDEYRLAYLAEVPVNWCPQLGTVLANEEVTNEGRSERGNYPVYKRPLKQWMLRITAYAQRLADDLNLVDWPESTKHLQRNWIGRSEGAQVDFTLDDPNNPVIITVFTTRPDTLFGATYMVLAPEHPLVSEITTPAQQEAVDHYLASALKKTEIDRQSENQEKTGVFTGAYAINPVNDERIPIWIADYVLTGYGTGAIMAVPAHDQRDFDFAKQFDLPIVRVVENPDKDDHDENTAFTGTGVCVNSANNDVSLDGLPTVKAKAIITDWLESNGLGKGKVQYKLRDWLFSRQRYWGEPFPILHGEDGEIRPVPMDQLPVALPEMENFQPEGSDDADAPVRPPLGRAPESWRVVELDGKRYERELNTMPQWAGSCWYYLRFTDPKNSERFVDKKAEQYWMQYPSPNANSKHTGGIDLYVGGVEHAVLHLLYARFWHKVLFDLGHVSTPEPFGKLFNQGYIQAYCYRDERGVAVPAEEVVDQDGKPAMEVQDQHDRKYFYNSQPVTQEYGKMGKSLKNAVSPDDMCEQFGCDTLRLYEMYMGPLAQSKPWNTRDIVGVHRFLNRLWRNVVDDETGALLVTEDAADDAIARMLHKTIKRVTEAMQTMSFNVAVAALIELNNVLVPLERVPRTVIEPMLLLVSPFAPHICEELWEKIGNKPSVVEHDWPTYDKAMLVEDMIDLPVQVSGKMRGKIHVPADADEDALLEAAKADAKISVHLEGKTIRKVIYIKGRLLNIVAN